jgi:hypothetical protein
MCFHDEKTFSIYYKKKEKKKKRRGGDPKKKKFGADHMMEASFE